MSARDPSGQRPPVPSARFPAWGAASQSEMPDARWPPRRAALRRPLRPIKLGVLSFRGQANVNDPDIANVLDTVFAPTTAIFGFREARGMSRSSIDGLNAYLAYFSDNPFATGLDLAVLGSPVPKNLGASSIGVWLYRPVPEPASLALFGVGIAAVRLIRRRKAR